MNIKMYESELHVMEVLWERGDLPAKEIAGVLNEKSVGTKIPLTQ